MDRGEGGGQRARGGAIKEKITKFVSEGKHIGKRRDVKEGGMKCVALKRHSTCRIWSRWGGFTVEEGASPCICYDIARSVHRTWLYQPYEVLSSYIRRCGRVSHCKQVERGAPVGRGWISSKKEK